MRLSVSLAALLLATGLANAADLIIDAPIADPIVSSTSDMRGVVEVGVLASHIEDTDGDNVGWVYGGYASAALWGQSDAFVWGLDGYVDANSWDRDEDADVPTYVGVVGAHAGFDIGAGSLGAFASVGAISDDDSPDYTTRWGYTVGVEGIAEVSSGFTVFGQLGYADARPDESDDDEGFTGVFGRMGAVFALSDDMALMADVSAGSSDSYIDGDEQGGFVAAGAKAAFRLPTDFDAFLTAGYEFAHYSAADDTDTGTTHTVKLGLSIPFGENTASDVLNPLATSVMPYRAGSWANAID